MTRKDYERLARALRDSRHLYAGDKLVYDSKRLQWLDTLYHIQRALLEDNPRFDHAAFARAAGADDDES